MYTNKKWHIIAKSLLEQYTWMLEVNKTNLKNDPTCRYSPKLVKSLLAKIDSNSSNTIY